MSDMTKTKAQLIKELETLQQRVVELENMLDDQTGDHNQPSKSTRPDFFIIDAQSSPQLLQEKIEKMEQTLARRIQEMTVLYEISLNITAELGKSDMLQKIIEQSAKLLGTHMGRIYILSSGQQRLELVGSYNCSKPWSDITIKAGEGLIGQVMITGQPLVISNYSNWENRIDALAEKIGRIIGVPLSRGGQIIGVLVVFDGPEKQDAFDVEDVNLLNMLAAQVAIALENWQLYSTMEHKVKELATLNRVSQAVNSTLDLQKTLTLITDYIMLQLDAAAASIALHDLDQDVMKFAAASGRGADFVIGRQLAVGRGIMGWVAQQGQPVLVADASQDSRFYDEFDRRQGDFITQSIVCVPLQARDQTIGVITALNKTNDSVFNEDDLHLLGLIAAPAATAIDNARFYQQAKQEITERKQIEQELRASEYRFKQVITSISDHIYVSEIGESGERINSYHSPNIQLLTGYPVEKFATDWHFWPSTLIHPDDRFTAAMQASKLSQGQSSEVEYRLMRADGSIIWVRDSARVEIKNQRQMIYGVVADITERKQRERELEIIVAVADALRSTATRTDIILIVLDQLLDLLQMEGAALATYDAASNTIIVEQARGAWAGTNEKQFSTAHQEQQYFFSQGNLYVNNDIQNDPNLPWPEAFKAVNAVAIVSLSIQNEFIGSLIVGHRHEITADVLPLLTTIGNMAVNALRRASLFEALQQSNNELANERALLAQRVEERTAELRAANAELARAARLKDEFMANMSHELRTPLNAILGMSEILRTNVYGNLNDEQLNAVHYIEEGGAHLLSLINDILDLSKIEAGKLDLLISPVAVAGVCQTSLQFVKPLIQQKEMKIVYSYDNSVDLILADERRLKQILVNLLTNAIKFSSEGSRIGLELEGDSDQDVVRFIVWDNGIGISQEDMRRLFKPFVQIDSGLTRRQEGTGLGLSLVYRLTEMHGGSVKLESEVDQGSCFTISLPWRIPADTEQSTQGQADQAAEMITGARSQSATILLAEDNEATIAWVRTYLNAHGYQVVVARDGVEAVKLALEIKPDIILMDVQMPNLNGIEAIRQIRQNDKPLNTTPIIALTALSLPGDQQRCLEAGADEYLRKPVSPSNLVMLMESKLKTR